jgi:hypothetical protein
VSQQFQVPVPQIHTRDKTDCWSVRWWKRQNSHGGGDHTFVSDGEYFVVKTSKTGTHKVPEELLASLRISCSRKGEQDLQARKPLHMRLDLMWDMSRCQTCNWHSRSTHGICDMFIANGWASFQTHWFNIDRCNAY